MDKINIDVHGEPATIHIIQNPKPNRNHILWYGGRVAEVVYRGWTFILGAYGDVCATLLGKKNEEIAYCKDKNNSGRFEDVMGTFIPDDKALRRVLKNGKLVFNNNNWFEVLVDDPDGNHHDTGWVCESDYYEEALNEMIDNMNLFIEETMWEGKNGVHM